MASAWIERVESACNARRAVARFGSSRGASFVELLVILAFIASAVATATYYFGRDLQRASACAGNAIASFSWSCKKTEALDGQARASTMNTVVPAAGDMTCDRLGCKGGGTANCFVAGTRVATPEGARPIESLAPGDFVLARDVTSGETAPKRVVAKKRTEARPLLAVELASADDGIAESLRVTQEHPFFVIGRGFVVAEALEVGDRIATTRGSTTVTSLEALAETATVFNVEVEDFHTYFVGRGEALVHNDCASDLKSALEKLAELEKAANDANDEKTATEIKKLRLALEKKMKAGVKPLDRAAEREEKKEAQEAAFKALRDLWDQAIKEGPPTAKVKAALGAPGDLRETARSSTPYSWKRAQAVEAIANSRILTLDDWVILADAAIGESEARVRYRADLWKLHEAKQITFGDYQTKVRAGRDVDWFNGAWDRLLEGVKNKDPDAVRAARGVLGIAKHNKLPPSWGGARRIELTRLIGGDDNIPTVPVDGVPLPGGSASGALALVKDLHVEYQLGFADWWWKQSDTKKAQVNEQLAGLDAKRAHALMKKLASSEIGERTAAEAARDRSLRDTRWLDELPAGVAEGVKRLDPAVQYQLRERYNAVSEGDWRVIEGRLERAIGLRATPAQLAGMLFDGLVPHNVSVARRFRYEKALREGKMSYGQYVLLADKQIEEMAKRERKSATELQDLREKAWIDLQGNILADPGIRKAFRLADEAKARRERGGAEETFVFLRGFILQGKDTVVGLATLVADPDAAADAIITAIQNPDIAVRSIRASIAEAAEDETELAGRIAFEIVVFAATLGYGTTAEGAVDGARALSVASREAAAAGDTVKAVRLAEQAAALGQKGATLARGAEKARLLGQAIDVVAEARRLVAAAEAANALRRAEAAAAATRALVAALEAKDAAKATAATAKALEEARAAVTIATRVQTPATAEAASHAIGEAQRAARLSKDKKALEAFQAFSKELAEAAKAAKGQDALRTAEELAAAARRISLPQIQKCFVAGTQVWVIGGGAMRMRAIEEVREGDLVVALDADEPDAVPSPKRVVRTFHRTSDHTRFVSFRDADGSVQRIGTTDEHPFWVLGTGFVAAEALRAGDHLLQGDGRDAVVVASDRQVGDVEVFNFEVEEAHTYFVAASAHGAPVLVHNACLQELLARKLTDAGELEVATRGAQRLAALEQDATVNALLRNLDSAANPAAKTAIETKIIDALLKAGNENPSDVVAAVVKLVDKIEGAPKGGGILHHVHETAATGKYAASKKVTETLPELQALGVEAGKPITSEYGVAAEIVKGAPTPTTVGGLTWHAEKVHVAVTELDKYVERLRKLLPVLDAHDAAEAARVRALIRVAEERANDIRPFLEAWKKRLQTHPGQWKLSDDGKRIVPVKPTTKLPNPIPGEVLVAP